MLNETVNKFIRNDIVERFLRYVRVDTKSDPRSGKHPSSEGQWELARLLKDELTGLGCVDCDVDQYCYVYGVLPASDGVQAEPITLCSHIDTAPAVSGENVTPQVHENYDGSPITFPKNQNVRLTVEQFPELKAYIGDTVITTSGDTLLGADNKAGVAEIMTAIAAFQKFKTLKHPEIRVVFTPDEEIAQGTDNITLSRLSKAGYTIDGGEVGEFVDECFDAYEVVLEFRGISIHPGKAKNRMVNAAAIAARFIAALPEYETPERTEKREGFYHVCNISGNESKATVELIVRDFQNQNNLRRIELINKLKESFMVQYKKLQIDVHVTEQYQNMRSVIEKYPQISEYAIKAIQQAGIKPIRRPIRGGTDGCRLSFKGVPMPNLFTGGYNFHSPLEWIGGSGLCKSCEVIIHLCDIWTNAEF